MHISTQYCPEKETDQRLMISEHSTHSNFPGTKTKNQKFVLLVPWEIVPGCLTNSISFMKRYTWMGIVQPDQLHTETRPQQKRLQHLGYSIILGLSYKKISKHTTKSIRVPNLHHKTTKAAFASEFTTPIPQTTVEGDSPNR